MLFLGLEIRVHLRIFLVFLGKLGENHSNLTYEELETIVTVKDLWNIVSFLSHWWTSICTRQWIKENAARIK
ncbi:hypothetical protein SDJN02_10307, partial [Cucurbita argyrosperma subsp. argyrosperma]